MKLDLTRNDCVAIGSRLKRASTMTVSLVATRTVRIERGGVEFIGIKKRDVISQPVVLQDRKPF
jgi:hypothetical protein